MPEIVVKHCSLKTVKIVHPQLMAIFFPVQMVGVLLIYNKFTFMMFSSLSINSQLFIFFKIYYEAPTHIDANFFLHSI